MTDDTAITPISDTTRRYWSDPAYAARLDAERDAVNARYFAAHDARSRAAQEARWAHEDLPERGLEA